MLQTLLANIITIYYNKLNYYGVVLMNKLTKRLQAIADMVEDGSVIVDVGTDHGYIPVYLVENGICDKAIACDINEGPLNSCIFLVRQLGLSEKITCVLSNGLDSINDSYDTIIIAGMGGELIADILSRARDINSKKLIINPMTHPELVRKWMYDNGFEIDKDIIVPDGKHHYNIISASYVGKINSKKDIDYYLGNIEDFSDKEYFKHLLVYLKNKQKSGIDYSSIINAIEEKI